MSSENTLEHSSTLRVKGGHDDCLTIYNCPLEQNTYLSRDRLFDSPDKNKYGMKVVTVIGLDHFYITELVKDDFNSFVSTGKVNSYELIEVFIQVLGFVPVYEETVDGNVYCGKKFSSIEEFHSLRLPIPYVNILGIDVAKVFVNNMSVLHTLCSDLNIPITDIQLDHFPDYVQMYIEEALRCLDGYDHTVESLSVYEYLGLLPFIYEGPMKIIHGEELVEIKDYIQCGYCYNHVRRVRRGLRMIDFDSSLLTEAIIKLSPNYRSLIKIHKNPLTKMDVFAMRLLIKQNGFAGEHL
jgi:hypothetical protein